MNYIQQAYKGLNDVWRYIVAILIIILGWQILGAIPLLVTAVIHSKDSSELMNAAQDNFMSLGINSNLFLFLMLFMFLVGLLALFFSVKTIHKRSITSLITSREKVDWKRVFFAFGLWFVFGVVMLVIGYSMSPENYTWNFKPIPFLLLVVISFLFMPIQTSLEELLFRGYFMQGLGVAITKKSFPFILFYLIVSVLIYIVLGRIFEYHQYNGLIRLAIATMLVGVLTMLLNTGIIIKINQSNLYKGIQAFLNTALLPLLVTSIAFGLLHGANPEVAKLGNIIMVYYIGTGLFLGMLTLLDEGTELALGFHAANNIVAAIFVTTTWTVFQTEALLIDNSEPSVGFETFLPVFVIYPLLLLVFGKKYGWTNWKGKLFGKIVKPLNKEMSDFFDGDSMLEV